MDRVDMLARSHKAFRPVLERNNRITLLREDRLVQWKEKSDSWLFQALYPCSAVTEIIHPTEVQVKVNETCMTIELDTGTSITIISKQAYQKTWPQDDLPLHATLVNETSYISPWERSTQKPACNSKYKDQKGSLQLLVLAGNGPSLLDQTWLHRLQLNWHEICQAQEAQTLQASQATPFTLHIQGEK